MGQGPPADRARHSLDQRVRHSHHGRERLAHLQRVAAFPVQDPERAHVSGLAIWKPVHLQEITAIFGGYESARVLHFLTMALLVLIVVVHIAMVILVPRTFPTMITGRARRAS